VEIPGNPADSLYYIPSVLLPQATACSLVVL
jgi:hypothetical protein